MKYQAIQMGLLSAKDAGRSMQAYRVVKRQEQPAQPETPSELEAYRAAWLLARKEYTEGGRAFLRSRASKTYQWLYEHDRDWLTANLPADKRVGDRVDWVSRDSQLAKEVRAAAECLKLSTSHPVQITKLTIAQEINQVNLLKQTAKYGAKLPLTMQVLTEVEETNEAFAIRRVWWAARLLYAELGTPQLWPLIRKASVYHARMWWPAVEEALHKALQVWGALLANQEIEPTLLERFFPASKSGLGANRKTS